MLYISFSNQTLEFPLYTVADTHLTLSLLRLGINGYIDLTVWDSNWMFEENKWFTVNVKDMKLKKWKEVPESVIKDNSEILFRSKSDEEDIRFTVLCIETNEDFVTYLKYVLPEEGTVTIGTDVNSDIRILLNAINPEHVELTVNEDGVFVTDLNSKKGTILNNNRLDPEEAVKVSPMDVLFLAGVKIIFLGDAIAINRPNKVKSGLTPLTALNAVSEDKVETEQDLFSRAPRLMEPLDEEGIVLEAPPNKKERDDLPGILQYGPSITMPMPMLTAALVNMSVNGRTLSSSIGIFCSMGLSALLGIFWGRMRNKYNKQKEATDEEHRRTQYTKYIEQYTDFITSKEEFNSNILHSQFLDTQSLMLALNDHKELIWNRNVNHPDFLDIRLGIGCRKNFNEIKVPDSRFSLTDDDLLELPFELADAHKYIENIPTTISLRKQKIIGVIGDYNKVHQVTKDIIIQVASLYSYSDVKICVLYNEDENGLYDWVRWLPHTFVADNKLRLVGNTPETRDRVINYLLGELGTRSVAGEEDPTGIRQADTGRERHYETYNVVIVTSEKLFEGNQLGSFVNTEEDLGTTFILAFSTLEGIPNRCKALIECSDNEKGFNGYYELDKSRDKTAEIKFDSFPALMPEWFARKISGLNIKEISSGEIPNSIDYLGMLGVGRLEQWDLAKKYREHRAYDSIRAQIGVGASGKEVFLDLHEKRHGPHGLLAGTTGSGKSETLQTAILSWLMNYSPEEVAFILIDYKGGGMANLFNGVPHVAGTITNISDDEGESDDEDSGESLDNSQTRRALTAIKAEITYRQGLFKNAKVNHIDGYMKLYRKGKVAIPLPHLVMISDEFAELKKEQPDFIKALVSAARVGRSLGIHLILATQKPSNSVDDEIWANSRFKICLRVQERADSTSMLKRPEAASITQTGRGYFQLGNNEIFELFQSGWSGADYIPKDKIELAEDNICKMIELDGTDTPIEVERQARAEDQLTQLEACVQYIANTCEELGISQARQLWPPQLTKKMYLQDLIEGHPIKWENGLHTYLGLVDDPERQTQYAADINFLNTSNLIIMGTQGMGKSTVLQTLLYSMMLHYTPEELNMYLLDFSSSALRFFSKTSYCGGYIVADDDPEKVTRLIQLLRTLIAERKELFEEKNVGNFTEYLRKAKVPLVLVVIDNPVAFFENYDPNLAGVFNDLIVITRECAKYGIQFVLTTSKASDIKYKLKQNFLNWVVLYMAEKGDYREVYNTPVDYIPVQYRGRGLWLANKKLLEWQAALPIYGKTESERNDALVESINEIEQENKAHRYKVARHIPIIPKDETYNKFFEESEVTNLKLPIGYNTVDISRVYLDLESVFCYSISDSVPENAGMLIGLRNTLYALKNLGIETHVLKFNRKLNISSSLMQHKYSKTDEVWELLRKIETEFYNRIDERNACKQKDENFNFNEYIAKQNRQIVVVIDNLLDFINFMESEDVKALDTENIKLGAKAKGSDSKLAEAYQLIFQNGEGYGIYFISGVINSGVTADIQRKPLFKEFVTYETALHFGGRLGDVKTFKFTGSLSEGNKVLDGNMATESKSGRFLRYFVPEFLD